VQVTQSRGPTPRQAGRMVMGNATSCSSIATSPNYGIDSIVAGVIETQDVGQAQATANIKNVLHQNKPVWFGWVLPTQTAWDNFQNMLIPLAQVDCSDTLILCHDL